MDRPRLTRPFETVEVDFKGPLTSSADGYRFILVLQNSFSKYAKMHPVVAPTTDITCSTLLAWISRYGIPTTFHSDRGSCFTSSQFRDFCIRFGIKNTLSTPAHPQANGAVKRLNCTMAEALTKVVNEDQHSWAYKLLEVNLAYNSAFHNSIGDTPYRVVFKESPRLLTDVAADHVQQPSQVTPPYLCRHTLTLPGRYQRCLSQCHHLSRRVHCQTT